MNEEAKGIPSKKEYGDVEKIPLRKLLTYVDQLHKAERAGLHHDIRFGDRELYSWAGRKGLPQPGEKHTLFQQPLHTPEYAEFEGEIPSGYGKGTVKTHDRGAAFVTEATPNKIKFVLAHRKNPEYYTMIKLEGERRPWLIINHTPMSPEKAVGSKEIFKKKHLGVIPSERVNEVMNDVVEGKIDGASGLFKLKENAVDVLSFRVGKGDRPIVHTERFFGETEPTFKVPKKFQNRVARGEIYSVDREGKPQNAQTTSPLLNMSLENSLKTQKERGLSLRAALFGFADRPLNYPEREAELSELLKYLPKEKFGRPAVAHTPEEAKKLWREISEGKHPETDEGVVAYPKEGNPVKVKLRPDYDVKITGVFPGEGKYKGSAGGIVYEGGGRVGTGFDDQYRRWLWDNRESIKGRIARITSTKKLPSGKYYQPSFVSLHEDYPTKEASDAIFTPDFSPSQLREMGAYREVYGPKGTPRLASLSKWPEHWYNEADPWGWLQWYDRYSKGRRIDDDKRQIKRWLAFKARHGGRMFQENPTPRRAYALRNWAIDPLKLIKDETKRKELEKSMENYRNKKYKTASDRPGLWENIRAKRARGERAAKPGEKGYPDKKQWERLTKDATDDRPHYHMILRIEAENLPDSKEDCNKLVKALADEIGMKIVYGPKTMHLTNPETEGYSSFAIITTSHISLHTWNKTNPPVMQIDVFSCNAFSGEKVESFLRNKFKVKKLHRVFLDRTSAIKSKEKKAMVHEYLKKFAASPAWQRSEGKNPEGGLNAKGRASYNRATGGNLKAPVTESKPSGDRAKRRKSFCARMCGHKRKNTGAATKSDPESRVNKALRKWRCKCGEELLKKAVLNILNREIEKKGGVPFGLAQPKSKAFAKPTQIKPKHDMTGNPSNFMGEVYKGTKQTMGNMLQHMRNSDPKGKLGLGNREFWRMLGQAPKMYSSLLGGDMKRLAGQMNSFGAGYNMKDFQ